MTTEKFVNELDILPSSQDHAAGPCVKCLSTKRSPIPIKTLSCLPTTTTTMSRRLYLGSKNSLILLINTFHSETTGLPTDARTEDVQKFFDGFGRIIDCRVMTGTF